MLFRNLTREQIKNIVDVQLENLQKRLAEKNMSIELDDKVRDVLAQRGYDPAFGASPLKRAMQKYIQPVFYEDSPGRIFRWRSSEGKFKWKQRYFYF